MNNLGNTVSLFEEMVSAISTKYLAEVKIMTATKGERPGFEELMVILKRFENELTQIGAKTIEANKNTQTIDKDSLTKKLHQVIKTNIESFVKQL